MPANHRAQTSSSLAQLIAHAQRRWGMSALRQGADPLRGAPPLPTGSAMLDTALDGGLPRGALTELLGAPTSGMTTLAFTTLAHTQAHGELGAYVDLSGTFDAAYASACGVALSELLLARPTRAADALELIEALIASGGLGVLVVDSLAWLSATSDGHVLLTSALRRLVSVLPRTATTIVVLTFLPYPTAVADSITGRGSPLAHTAALRLHMTRRRWDITGETGPAAEVEVTVVKYRGAPDGSRVDVSIAFPSDWELP